MLNRRYQWKLNNCFLLVAIILAGGCIQNTSKESPWLQGVKEVKYFTRADSTYQPALIYAPNKKIEKLPLLVALHTWSYNYKQKSGIEYAKWTIQNDWYLIHPNFRGPNNNPKAMGSEYAVQDIVSAVEYMKNNYSIDENRIYLIGSSGGGHAALLMAGRHPEIWAAVSAWNGISDLKKWWVFNKEYAEQIEAAVGGRPDSSETAAAECLKRSPLTYLQNAGSVKLDINAGIEDETVPFIQSLLAYNQVVNDNQKINTNTIDEIYLTKEIPAEFSNNINDSEYGEKIPLFRKVSGNTRVTIFKGGHEIVYLAALKWLGNQKKDTPPIWQTDSNTILN